MTKGNKKEGQSSFSSVVESDVDSECPHIWTPWKIVKGLIPFLYHRRCPACKGAQLEQR